MQNTPKGLRLQIGFFGRRNTGKSSLLNALARQDVAIVSDFPGTTTDPIDKAMEILPLGPVLLIDTAGLDDDAEEIGALRVERSRKVFERCDLALLVVDSAFGDLENDLLQEFDRRKIPCVTIWNKSDLSAPDPALETRFRNEHRPFVALSAKTGSGLADLRAAVIAAAPEDFLSAAAMLGDLTKPGKPVLLITPIDKEAPKGRLILPEVQAIRDTLDHDAYCVVVKENAVSAALANMKSPPLLAVTDSQAFSEVAKLVPPEIPLTGFSILMARLKGDLTVCAAGAAVIDTLKDGDRILVAEACSHHPIGEDIGRVKLPRWIREYTGKQLEFRTVQGEDFPPDLASYRLVLHCGACTFNRKAVLSRILRCTEAGVAYTNYGVAIAHVKGILERALRPFPGAYQAFIEAGKHGMK